MVDYPLAFIIRFHYKLVYSVLDCVSLCVGLWVGGMNREAAERRQMMLARVLSSEARERCET
jgi:hypothetical protein